MKIAILGANGQLGQECQRILPGPLIALSRKNADLTQPVELRRTLESVQPTIVINCGAHTLVDQAEAEPQAAFAANAWGVRDLAQICQELDCTLIHFSTNYVFGLDEMRNQPYDEDELPGPNSTYGISKLAGEYFVRSLCPKHFILRTCGLYGHAGLGSKRSNFVETMLRKAGQGQPLRLVHDQVCTPTATFDLAQAVAQVMTSDRYGLYHVTNSGACTWFEFAQAIFTIAQRTVTVLPIRSHDYTLPAKRPGYSVLDNTRWAKQGFKPLRSWQEALQQYLAQREQISRAA